jgi:hypothetical protein
MSKTLVSATYNFTIHQTQSLHFNFLTNDQCRLGCLDPIPKNYRLSLGISDAGLLTLPVAVGGISDDRHLGNSDRLAAVRDPGVVAL